MLRSLARISAALVAFAIPLQALALDSGFDNGTRAPGGIVPTTMTLAQLREHRAALNAVHADVDFTSHWTIAHAGETGTIFSVQRGHDERVDRTIHGMHLAYGTLAGRSWEQNANGEIVYEHDLHRRTQIDRRSEARLAPQDVQLLGEVEQPVRAYVVRVSPPDGRLEYVFYDAATYRTIRREASEDGTRVVTTYGDFTPEGAVTVAGHIGISVASTGDSSDEQLVSYDDKTPVAESAVAIPAATSPLFFTSPATIPVDVSSDRIIVRVRINGRPINLQLDSGADSILIDRSVLKDLGIHPFGEHEAEVAGTFPLAQALVPEIDFGNAKLKNVFVETTPFAQVADEHTIVAGLLGFDFIAGSVLKIDYVNQKLQLFDPASFTPPAGAFAQTIDAEDNVPVLAATLRGQSVPHFIMDTGADRSTLYSSYVDTHPETTKDQGLGTEKREAYPFERAFMGVGGDVDYRPLELGPFGIAGVTFSSWIFDATHNAASFEDEDYDGLIGQDVLRYFDVYIDYPHEKVYFIPNKRYRDRYS